MFLGIVFLWFLNPFWAPFGDPWGPFGLLWAPNTSQNNLLNDGPGPRSQKERKKERKREEKGEKK